MDRYKNKYGLMALILLILFWYCAIRFGRPELLEIAGAALIIQAMHIWKYDYKNLKAPQTGRTLDEIDESFNKSMAALRTISDEIAGEKGFKSLEKDFSVFSNEVSQIKRDLEHADVNTEKHYMRLLDTQLDNLNMNVKNLIKLGSNVGDLISTQMYMLENLTAHTKNTNDIKNMFVNIEVSLIVSGTVYWACGTMIFEGWQTVSEFIVRLW